MEELDVRMTLGDLVTQRPTAVAVLARRGLDFCCGGRRTLADACFERGIDPDSVLAEVAAVQRPEESEPWATMRPAELADHIESTHHAYLHAQLEVVSVLAEKVAAVHGGRHPEVLDVYADVRDLVDEMVPHLAKEERVLFPMIRALAGGGAPPLAGPPSVDMPIAVMTREHDTAGVLLGQLRLHSHGFEVPDDACASYRALYEGLAALEADTHLHIHKENNLLFPAARKLESRRVAHVPKL